MSESESVERTALEGERPDDGASADDTDLGYQYRQYEEWGVSIHTSNVRPVHIANGIVQLLRLANSSPTPPPRGPGFTRAYTAAAKRALGSANLTAPAKALCVTRTKRGEVRLDAPTADEPIFMPRARAHFVSVTGHQIDRDKHVILASVVNADGKVMASGGDDPTTPGLLLAGYSSTHTLAGMHAATFLGLLSRTPEGCRALATLYALLADGGDSHSALIAALQLGDGDAARTRPVALDPAQLASVYPLPSGAAWDALAVRTGRLVSNLLSWNQLGISKSDTLMAVIDLCALLLTLRLLLWAPDEPTEPRLLLMLSPTQVTSHLRQAVVRAQESLKLAGASLDAGARNRGLLEARGARQSDRYLPSNHAFNLGAAGGWLYPLDSRGGSKRYFRPGPRQLMTLVRSLIIPGAEMSWRDFSEAAEGLGIAVGGVNEYRTAARLGLGAAAESIRRIGQANRDHLVTLGLARRESDNLVIVDGGAS